jgi:hypothetical protein
MVPEKKIAGYSIIKWIRFLCYHCHLRYAYRFVISVAEENLSEAEESEKVGLISLFARSVFLLLFLSNWIVDPSFLIIQGRFEHPYTEFLFFGEDTARDFIPVKQLREKYDQPRYEASGDENGDDGSANSWTVRLHWECQVRLLSSRLSTVLLQGK